MDQVGLVWGPREEGAGRGSWIDLWDDYARWINQRETEFLIFSDENCWYYTVIQLA